MKTVAALALLALTLPLALPASAETAQSGRCDASGILVCAGTDVGGVVQCSVSPSGVGQCSWTRGFIWSGFSRAGLPGTLQGSGSYTVSTCTGISGYVCTSAAGADAPQSCTFLGVATCDISGGSAGSYGPLQLSFGECVRVVIAMSSTVQASVTTGLTIASTTYTNSGEDAGAACYDDNGR